MSTYSWKFYSARRGVSLKRLVEEKEMSSYEEFVGWCVKNRVTPPSKEVFNEEVGSMLKKPVKQKAPTQEKTEAKKSTTPKKSTRSTRKTGTKSK